MENKKCADCEFHKDNKHAVDYCMHEEIRKPKNWNEETCEHFIDLSDPDYHCKFCGCFTEKGNHFCEHHQAVFLNNIRFLKESIKDATEKKDFEQIQKFVDSTKVQKIN